MTLTTTFRFYSALLAFHLFVSSPALASNSSEGPVTNSVIKRSHSVALRPKVLTSSTKKIGVRKQSVVTLPAPVAVATPTILPLTPQAKHLVGVVLKSDGQPLPGASIYLAGAPRQLVVTDAQGRFDLPVATGSAVDLRVEYFGEGSSRVEVPANQVAPLKITLGQ
jgi:hypothetical protein